MAQYHDNKHFSRSIDWEIDVQATNAGYHVTLTNANGYDYRMDADFDANFTMRQDKPTINDVATVYQDKMVKLFNDAAPVIKEELQNAQALKEDARQKAEGTLIEAQLKAQDSLRQYAAQHPGEPIPATEFEAFRVARKNALDARADKYANNPVLAQKTLEARKAFEDYFDSYVKQAGLSPDSPEFEAAKKNSDAKHKISDEKQKLLDDAVKNKPPADNTQKAVTPDTEQTTTPSPTKPGAKPDSGTPPAMADKAQLLKDMPKARAEYLASFPALATTLKTTTGPVAAEAFTKISEASKNYWDLKTNLYKDNPAIAEAVKTARASAENNLTNYIAEVSGKTLPLPEDVSKKLEALGSTAEQDKKKMERTIKDHATPEQKAADPATPNEAHTHASDAVKQSKAPDVPPHAPTTGPGTLGQHATLHSTDRRKPEHKHPRRADHNQLRRETRTDHKGDPVPDPSQPEAFDPLTGKMENYTPRQERAPGMGH